MMVTKDTTCGGFDRIIATHGDYTLTVCVTRDNYYTAEVERYDENGFSWSGWIEMPCPFLAVAMIQNSTEKWGYSDELTYLLEASHDFLGALL